MAQTLLLSLTDDPSDAKKLRNEQFFREINERIAGFSGLAEEFGSPDGEESFVCECWRLDCAERIAVSVDDYRRVRSDPETYIVLRDHADPTIDDVIEQRGSAVIVRKRVDRA